MPTPLHPLPDGLTQILADAQPQLRLFQDEPVLPPPRLVTPPAALAQAFGALAQAIAPEPIGHRSVRVSREQEEAERQAAADAEAAELALRSAAASPDDRLLLVDGRTILDGAYHASAALGVQTPRDSEGCPIGGVRGYASALLRLLGAERPTHAAVVFDHPCGSLSRRAILPEYKADRPEKPLDHLAQIELAKTFSKALGLCVICSEAGEADDVIATLHRRAPAAWTVIVSSTDKDLLQLCDRPRTVITCWREKQQVRTEGAEAARQRLGVKPSQVVDFLALAGDQADGIPGVTGIGPATASALLASHGTLDGIYSSLGGLSVRGAERVRQLLRTGRTIAYKSKALAQLRIELSDSAIPSALGMFTELRWGWERVDHVEVAALAKRIGLAWMEREAPL